MAKRDTSRYQFRRGRKIVHRGVTNNLKRREQEHRRKYGGGRISKIGPKVSRASALRWERAGGKRI